MDNKKVTNLLRAVADFMDQATEVVVETQKEIVKNVEKSQEETRKASEDFLSHSLKLIKKIEENDAIRAYHTKLGKTNKNLADALEEIRKMREKAIEDMMKDANSISNPMDLMSQVVKNTEKMGKQFTKEVGIMNEAVQG
jgi:ribosome recycling factor